MKKFLENVFMLSIAIGGAILVGLGLTWAVVFLFTTAVRP